MAKETYQQASEAMTLEYLEVMEEMHNSNINHLKEKGEKIMMTRNGKLYGEQVMLDGMMAHGVGEDGQRVMAFECVEDVEAKPFQGVFDVQGMRDGNVYMEERKKAPTKQRGQGKTIHRRDHSKLSMGVNGVYYFTFQLAGEQVAELSRLLSKEASEIAVQFSGEFYKQGV